MGLISKAANTPFYVGQCNTDGAYVICLDSHLLPRTFTAGVNA